MSTQAGNPHTNCPSSYFEFRCGTIPGWAGFETLSGSHMKKWDGQQKSLPLFECPTATKCRDPTLRFG